MEGVRTAFGIAAAPHYLVTSTNTKATVSQVDYAEYMDEDEVEYQYAPYVVKVTKTLRFALQALYNHGVQGLVSLGLELRMGKFHLFYVELIHITNDPRHSGSRRQLREGESRSRANHGRERSSGKQASWRSLDGGNLAFGGT